MPSIDQLISAVRTAPSHGALCDAYLAARRPCIAVDRMGDLITANEEAETRLGADQAPSPVAFQIVDGAIVSVR